MKTKHSGSRKPQAGGRIPPADQSRPSTLVGAVLLLGLTALVYLPALNGGFILDDYWLLARNQAIRSADGLLHFWNIFASHDAWPLTNTSFWFEWRLWGMDSTGYHVTNVVLHIADAALIWLILHRLSLPGAFVAALLFAVHPVNVESVAWISQRKNLLALTFFLISIWCFIEHEQRRKPNAPSLPLERWYWCSFAAFVLAMLSKASVAVLPAVLLLLVWWRRPLRAADLLRVLPFLVVAALLTVVNIWLQAHASSEAVRDAGVLERLLAAGAILWFYLYKAVLPVNLAFHYPQWEVSAADLLWWLPLLAALACTGLLLIYQRPWSRAVLFAWLYFCICLLPVLGLTDITYMEHSLVADHYQHLALIGVTALAAAGWELLLRRRQSAPRALLWGVALVVLALLSVLTWRQSALYVDSITQYRDTLQKNPRSWLAHNNLGVALFDEGKIEAAIGHYEEVLRLNPQHADTHRNLCNTLRRIGRIDEALRHCNRALELYPSFPEALSDLAAIHVDQGKLEEAFAYCREALRVRPNLADAHNILGIALAKAERLEEAMRELRQAIALDPFLADAYNNLGIVLANQGKLDEAIRHFDYALRLKPALADARHNLEAARQMRR